MPSIETITTSHIVIPSRVAARDRRLLVDPKQEPSTSSDVAVDRTGDAAPANQPTALFRVSDAVPLATLFSTAAPVDLDVEAVEGEIAKILAMLEDDSPDASPADTADLPAPVRPSVTTSPFDTRADTLEATASPTVSPSADAPSRPPPRTSSLDATPLEPHTADDERLTPPQSVPATPPSQTPASPTEVAARLANLIADHKSLLEEFAAATEHLGSAQPEDAPDQPDVMAPDNDAAKAVDADSALPESPSDDAAPHDETDGPPPAVAPLPAWSSAAEASDTTGRDPVVESLVRAIAAAQSYVPIAPPVAVIPPAPIPPAPAPNPANRIEVAPMAPDRIAYAAVPEAEPVRLNPVPGFLGGVAVSGMVGAALWAVLQG